MKSFNIWYLSSFLISLLVILPVITVFSSYFQSTSNYSEILKNTFLLEYILNSGILLPNSQIGDESKTILFSNEMKHYIPRLILFSMFD